jgi:uncharacterized protein (TIGR02996 family)
MSIPDEQAALLRAIVAHAEEDTPRLVYADWLQEQGDVEQAGFIRDSIALVRTTKGAHEREALAARLRELAEERYYGWYKPFINLDEVTIDRFERGFPYRITFGTEENFFELADALFAFVPIRALGISADVGSQFDNDSLVQFAALPGLARLTDLRLYQHGQLLADAWGELFRSPYLNGLTFLSLPSCGIYEDEAKELASARPLANLTDLDLSYNTIGVEGAQAILDSPHLTKLKNLWLEHNFFGEEEDEDAVLEALEVRFGDGLHLHDSPEDSEDDAM